MGGQGIYAALKRWKASPKLHWACHSENCSWGSGYDSTKTRITWLCKKRCLSHIMNGIYNSVKYELKCMRHNNANMHVARKEIESKNSAAATSACTGHRLVYEKSYVLSIQQSLRKVTACTTRYRRCAFALFGRLKCIGIKSKSHSWIFNKTFAEIFKP